MKCVSDVGSVVWILEDTYEGGSCPILRDASIIDRECSMILLIKVSPSSWCIFLGAFIFSWVVELYCRTVGSWKEIARTYGPTKAWVSRGTCTLKILSLTLNINVLTYTSLPSPMLNCLHAGSELKSAREYRFMALWSDCPFTVGIIIPTMSSKIEVGWFNFWVRKLMRSPERKLKNSRNTITPR